MQSENRSWCLCLDQWFLTWIRWSLRASVRQAQVFSGGQGTHTNSVCVTLEHYWLQAVCNIRTLRVILYPDRRHKIKEKESVNIFLEWHCHDPDGCPMCTLRLASNQSRLSEDSWDWLHLAHGRYEDQQIRKWMDGLV